MPVCIPGHIVVLQEFRTVILRDITDVEISSRISIASMLLVCIAIVALGRLRYGFMSFDFTLVEGVRVGVYQILPFVLGLFAHAHGLFRIDSIMLVIFLEGNQAGESETCREAPKEGYENAISVGPYTSARSSQWKTTETNYRFRHMAYRYSLLPAIPDAPRHCGDGIFHTMHVMMLCRCLL